MYKLPLPSDSASDRNGELTVKLELGKAVLFMNFDKETNVLSIADLSASGVFAGNYNLQLTLANNRGK